MTEKFSVLIVDDIANNRFTLRALLSRLPDCEIVEADSGEATLRCTVERDIHLILLDVQMPGMDGFETAEHLQMTARTRHIPIIFVTAVFKASEFIAHGFEIGAVDYLAKPIDDNLMLSRVRLYQHLHERNRELEFERHSLEVKVRERTAHLQALFDAAVEVAIISMDPQGRITLFNHGAELMLGYTENEVCGQLPLIFHRDAEVRLHARLLTELWKRPISAFETFAVQARNGLCGPHNWVYVRKDGGTLHVSLAISAVHDEDGRVSGFLGIARNISAQLEAENKLINLNLQLEQRVQERTQALQASTAQLQEAIRTLSRTQDHLVQSETLAALGSVVAGVAHELNTPLGNCLMVASTMRDKTVEFERLIAAQQLRRSELDSYLQVTNDALELLLRGLQRAAEFVLTFKQLAVDQTSSARRSFYLNEVIRGVAALLNSSLRRTPYRLELEIPDGLNMDSYPGPIEQVVSNLVNNSVLHGFAGRDHGLMRLTANVEGDSIRMIYSDDGCGMSNEVQRQIFAPFFTTRMGTGGSGLGMHISYNLVTGPLGGSIEVASVPGQGCTFTLVLPRVAPNVVANG
ncbi:MAG: response regulator [Pseudomonas sp.]|uniref:response regulator n=1 Tax=Pseudomonas sp. TaxID=306 RepID=UPI00273735CC|nr:response regulator [Pseudomonas sp.]MDP3847445.1 response regulator [Pseudomonas sp.]